MCSLFFILQLFQIKNLGTLNCFDTLAQNVKSGKPGLYSCHKMGSNQVGKLEYQNFFSSS